MVVFRVYIWTIHLTVLQEGKAGNGKLHDYVHSVDKVPGTHPQLTVASLRNLKEMHLEEPELRRRVQLCLR